MAYRILTAFRTAQAQTAAQLKNPVVRFPNGWFAAQAKAFIC